MSEREPLFSVTRSDFDWHTQRGRGAGGQHRNKTDSAVRCVHRASGAVGYAEDDRSQHQNRKLAWKRCIETPVFQAWLKKEIARRSVDRAEEERRVGERVDQMMRAAVVEVGDGETWRTPEDDYDWTGDPTPAR